MTTPREKPPHPRTLAVWASILALAVLIGLPVFAAGAAPVRAEPMSAAAMAGMAGMTVQGRSRPCRSPSCALACAASLCSLQATVEPLGLRDAPVSGAIVYAVSRADWKSAPLQRSTPPPR